MKCCHTEHKNGKHMFLLAWSTEMDIAATSGLSFVGFFFFPEFDVKKDDNNIAKCVLWVL